MYSERQSPSVKIFSIKYLKTQYLSKFPPNQNFALYGTANVSRLFSGIVNNIISSKYIHNVLQIQMFHRYLVCLPCATILFPSLLLRMSTFTNAMVLPTLRHSAIIEIISPFLAGLMYLKQKTHKQNSLCTSPYVCKLNYL